MTHSQNSRTNNFNLLRLIFATMVLLSHAPELADGDRSREILTNIFHTLSFGELGVDGFFLLSGYLIVQSWTSRPQAFVFLQKRVLRIYPAFIVSSLVCAFIVGPLAADPATYFAHFVPAPFIRGMVILQIPRVPEVFHGTHNQSINGAMWTIAYEFRCYLLVLLAGLTGVLRHRLVWLIVTAAILGLTLAEQFGYRIGHYPPWLHFDAVSVRFLTFFFSGGCFYLYRDVIPMNGRIALGATAVLIAGMFFMVTCELAFAIAGGYVLLYLALKPIPQIAAFNRLPDVSYGLYLYGFPLEKLILWYWPTISPWLLFPIALLSGLGLGVLSWYAVEKPFMALKPKSLRARRAPTAVLVE